VKARLDGGLIGFLSMLGLAMAIGTVTGLPPSGEGPLWLTIFLIDAVVIARRAPGRFFAHGFLVGLANWVWVACAHVVRFDGYAAHHASEIAALRAMPLPALPEAAETMVRIFRRYALPIPGASALIIGSLAWLASRIPAFRVPATRPGA